MLLPLWQCPRRNPLAVVTAPRIQPAMAAALGAVAVGSAAVGSGGQLVEGEK